MKFTPASSAVDTMRTQSSTSGLPIGPNIMAPRQYSLTVKPVRPSGRYLTKISYRLGTGGGESLQHLMCHSERRLRVGSRVADVRVEVQIKEHLIDPLVPQPCQVVADLLR